MSSLDFIPYGATQAGAMMNNGTSLLGTILGGVNSSSYGTSTGFNEAWSQSNSAENSWNWSKGMSDSWSNSDAESWSESRTLGHEASAEDILRAREANQVQADMWMNQALYNAKQAAIDRAYQAEMSNTSYQRAVEDLKRAGLNPILAAMNMGASTPSGAMASSGLATANKATTYADSYSNSYGYNRSRSGSHSEQSSAGGSSGYSSSSSRQKGLTKSRSSSNSETQAKSIMDGLGKVFNGLGSALGAADKADKETQEAIRSGRRLMG